MLPSIFTLSIAGVANLFRKKPLLFYLERLTAYLLPVIAFGHVFKALLKTTSRLPYSQYAIDKPKGLYFADKILNTEITLNSFSRIEKMVIILGIGGLTFSVILSLRKLNNDTELQKINKSSFSFMVILLFTLFLYGPVLGKK